MPCLLLTTNVDDRDQVTTVFTWIYMDLLYHYLRKETPRQS
jgi:hypothetical protein